MGIGWAAAWALAASLGAGVDARICAAAATRGQELRDSGDLLGAREQLRTCAASECPKEIRTDCGRWLSKVDEMLPSVVLAVREGSADVEGVEVSINGVPHVRDGRPIEMNPGRYRVSARFGSAPDSSSRYSRWELIPAARSSTPDASSSCWVSSRSST